MSTTAGLSRITKDFLWQSLCSIFASDLYFPIRNLSSPLYGTFVPLYTTSVPLTPAPLTVFSVPTQLQVFEFTNTEVKKQVEAGDPSKARTAPSSRTLRAEILSFANTRETRFLVKAQPSD